MSLHLLKVSSNKTESDPDNKTSADPTTWTAQYQVNYSTPSCDTDRGGRAFWFEVDVERGRSGEYQAKLYVQAPAKTTLRESLLKLAEWARMLAAGVEECDLPDEGFPVEVRRRVTQPTVALLEETAS